MSLEKELSKLPRSYLKALEYYNDREVMRVYRLITDLEIAGNDLISDGVDRKVKVSSVYVSEETLDKFYNQDSNRLRPVFLAAKSNLEIEELRKQQSKLREEIERLESEAKGL